MVQQVLEKEIRHQVETPLHARVPRARATFAVQLQSELVKREDMDVEQGQAALHDQQSLERTPQLIRRHDKRDRGLRRLRL